MARASVLGRSRFVVAPGLFRVVLAYLVAVDHGTGMAIGSCAVYLFFVLSGYWVHRMWFKEYASKRAPYRVFMISRFWRLLPVFYACVALRIVVANILHTPFRLERDTGWPLVRFAIAQATLLGHSQLPPYHSVLFPAWSLDIELQFYFVAPFVIYVLAKYAPFAWPRVALVACAVVGFALFLTVFRDRPQSSYLPMYLIFFLVGTYCSQYDVKPSNGLAAASAASAIVVLFFGGALEWANHSVFPSAMTEALVANNPAVNVLAGVLGIGYTIATVNRSVAPERRANDRVFSSLSYEIYLVHLTAFDVLYRFHPNVHGRGLGSVLTLVLLFPASWLVFAIVDRPIDRLRTRWVKMQPAAV